MIRIGLIGEDPNDTVAIQNLLKPKIGSIAHFKTVCRNIKGCQLESAKFYRAIDVETRIANFDILICIRDLDAFKSEVDKIKERNAWFEKVKKSANNCNTVFLLNIWEIEAIIFADLSPFNKKYGTKLAWSKDPSSIKEPKEKLKAETKKAKRRYVESDSKDLFAELDFDKVVAKCSFFKDFLLELKQQHKTLKNIA